MTVHSPLRAERGEMFENGRRRSRRKGRKGRRGGGRKMECLEAVWRRGRRRGGQLRVRARPLLTFGSPLERSALGRAGRRRRLLFIHLASNYRHYFIQFIALFNVIQTDRELDGNYFDLLLLFFLSLFLSFFLSFLPSILIFIAQLFE